MGDGVNNIRLISLVMYIVLVAHVSGCLFYFIGGIEIDYGIAQSWISINDYDVVSEDFGESYSKALYWGLTTLMSGESQMDVNPQTPVERFYIVLIIVIGAILGAMVIGNLTIILEARVQTVKRYRDRLHEIEELFSLYDVKPEMKARIKKYTDFEFSVSKGFDFEGVVGVLPYHMKRELKVQVGR